MEVHYVHKAYGPSGGVHYIDVHCSSSVQYVTIHVHDKRDSFTFNIVNFPHLSSNISSKPAYGLYISQLVRIGRICSNFVQFKLRHYTLTQKPMKQGFWYSGLCMAF